MKVVNYIKNIFVGIWHLGQGMYVTMLNFCRPKVTQQYPENRGRREYGERFRALLTMPHDAENHHKCIACGMYSTNASTTSEAAFSAVCAFRSARREPSGSRTSSSMPSSRRSGCCFSSIGRALRRLRNQHPLRNRPLRHRKEGRHRRRPERNQKRNKSWKG